MPHNKSTETGEDQFGVCYHVSCYPTRHNNSFAWYKHMLTQGETLVLRGAFLLFFLLHVLYSYCSLTYSMHCSNLQILSPCSGEWTFTVNQICYKEVISILLLHTFYCKNKEGNLDRTIWSIMRYFQSFLKTNGSVVKWFPTLHCFSAMACDGLKVLSLAESPSCFGNKSMNCLQNKRTPLPLKQSLPRLSCAQMYLCVCVCVSYHINLFFNL